jgi:hypothetical protein
MDLEHWRLDMCPSAVSDSDFVQERIPASCGPFEGEEE